MGRLKLGLSTSLFVLCTSAQALGACVQASQDYPLVTKASAEGAQGSVQIERIEGEQKLVLIELEGLKAPERLGAGMREFVVWVQGEDGQNVRAGTLRYDRALKSGNLMATTSLPRFTVRVTGERDANVTTPSSVLLAERKVVLN